MYDHHGNLTKLNIVLEYNILLAVLYRQTIKFIDKKLFYIINYKLL